VPVLAREYPGIDIERIGDGLQLVDVVDASQNLLGVSTNSNVWDVLLEIHLRSAASLAPCIRTQMSTLRSHPPARVTYVQQFSRR